MNIAEAIMHIYPNASPVTDFAVRDDSDGNGQYIDEAAWKIDGPIPTNEELQAAWDELSTPKIGEVKKVKIAELNEVCNSSILAGFTSSASGDAHTYAFDYEAQINFAGAKQFFADHPDLTIEWSTEDDVAVTLTKSQFDALWMDGFVFKNTSIGKYRTLKGQVEAASTIEEVNAVAW